MTTTSQRTDASDAPARVPSRPRSAEAERERRALVKAAAVDLAANLAAHGARTSLGKISPRRGSVSVRQDARPRALVEVRVDDDGAPEYTFSAGAGETTAFDVDAVRRAVLAPRGKGDTVWFVLVALVAWVLVATAAAIVTDAVDWLVLGVVVVAGFVVTVLAGLLVRRGRLRRRERRARERLGGVRVRSRA